LHGFAVTMRQHVSDDLERGAQSAQATLSARVLTFVPVAVLALLLATDADVRTVIAGPTGATVISVGLALDAAGALWMRRIIRPATTGRGR
jgi:tight adherence protein B